MTPDLIHRWIEAVGGRRFILTIGAGIVNTGLLIGHFLTENTYAQLTMATVAVFIAGASWKKDRTTPTSSEGSRG